MLAMAAVAACGLSACGDRPAAPAADSLTSAGTPIELERTDSDYLSEPLAFTTGASSTFVSDAASGTVLEYASGGAFVRRIGARGNGPGQFVGPTALAVVGDTALLVADAALRRINVFSLDAGVARGAYRVEAQAANLAVRTDTIVMGMQDLAQSTSAGILILGDSMVRRIGALPKTLRAFPRLAENYPLSYAVMSGDVIRVAFMGSDQLYTIDTRGALRDSIRLPARHRIGVPNDLDARLANPKARGSEAAPASVLSFVGALADQSTVLVHVDFAMQNGAVGARAWLSRIDAAGRVTCNDVAVPIAADARAVFALRGDTLLVLQHRARAVTGVMATTVSRYPVPRC
mgnify:FL=1